MLEFQEKKKLRKFLYSRLTLIALGILAAITASAAYRMYQKAAETGEKRTAAVREEETLKSKTGDLESHLSQLKTERGIEEEIRKKYRVVKEGESVIIVVDDQSNAANAAGAQSGFQSLWDKMRSYFR